MKYTKQEKSDLKWLGAMCISDLTLQEIADKIGFKHTYKLKLFLEENKREYKNKKEG